MAAQSILWFRQDLRLSDNPALRAALERGTVIPVYIWAPEEEGQWAPGAASRWWLHQSLTALQDSLARCGSKLVLRRGNSLEQLNKLVRETGATSVFWNRRYEPAIIERDRDIKAKLEHDGCSPHSFNSHLLFEPWTIQNKSAQPFRVFTPFWRTCLSAAQNFEVTVAPKRIPGPDRWPESLALSSFELEPKINWADGIRRTWHPGEAGAQANLDAFIKSGFEKYDEGRNRPDMVGTSRLSPHLHFGEIGPRQIWHAIESAAAKKGSHAGWKNSQYLAELGWREFGHHLLFHFPHTPLEPLRPEFAKFPWHENHDWLRAWQRGRTGFPIVDAGMRELWATGWMHNRVRMVVASFLVKDLLQPWQAGAKWFWDTLVDADLANNTLGWQWTAGCGADAMPYFRIFNPISQGEKFDPRGDYVRRWVPELGRLPEKWIHHPWEAPEPVLRAAGIRLDETYPKPIVSHSIAREVALEAYKALE